MFLVPTSRVEIEKVISDLKDRNGGVVNIHSRVLKTIARHIRPVLESVLNDCISSGYWPMPLKQADIVPVFKSGNATAIDNYRPISLISNLAKIFEKLIHSRLIVFLEKFCRVNKNQYGFLRNVNTTSLLDRIVNEIYESVNKDEAVLATFIDLSKAFDTARHDLLLTELEIEGIRGLALNLMKSYLSDRGQRMKINGVTSQVKTVSTGVPQGTVLGPLLFIIYVNDIFNYCPGTYAFADDTIVVRHAETWSEVQEDIRRSLLKIDSWFTANKLTMNVSKTEHMTFGCNIKSVPLCTDIQIRDFPIRRATNVKYLGIRMDYRLKWDQHIQYVMVKLRYTPFIMFKLKHLPMRVLVTIYYAYVYSIINYGLTIWGGAYKSEITQLGKLHGRILQVVKDKDIPTIRELYVVNCIMFHYAHLSYSYRSSCSKTRTKCLPLPNHKKTIYVKNSLYTAIKYFNLLPNSYKDLKCSAKIIKKKMLCYFIVQSN
ncbi:hypothetical protein TKK_0017285 [Trichogramma kaykai]